MVAKILSDISEEMLEQGKATVQTAKQQITGDQNIGRQHFKEILGSTKEMTPEQLEEAKKRDKARSNAMLDQINKGIQIARQKREQPEAEEKKEKLIENKKLEEETKAQKKKEELSASISQNIGSHEQGKFVVG